jgi:hypothetical protein
VNDQMPIAIETNHIKVMFANHPRLNFPKISELDRFGVNLKNWVFIGAMKMVMTRTTPARRRRCPGNRNIAAGARPDRGHKRSDGLFRKILLDVLKFVRGKMAEGEKEIWEK